MSQHRNVHACKVIPKTAYTAGTMFYLVGILHQNYNPDMLAYV